MLVKGTPGLPDYHPAAWAVVTLGFRFCAWGLDIPALMPLSQIPPQRARGRCTPFHTHSSQYKSIKYDISKTKTFFSSRQTNITFMIVAALMAAVRDIATDYTVKTNVIFLTPKLTLSGNTFSTCWSVKNIYINALKRFTKTLFKHVEVLKLSGY